MKTIKNLFLATALSALGVVAVPVFAQATMDPAKMGNMKTGDMKMSDSVAGEMSDAEVRKVDKAQGKITLKHGEIKNLDMPGMTMVFTVKDKAMLDKVKPGDKVKFKAVDESGKLTVVEMAPAK